MTLIPLILTILCGGVGLIWASRHLMLSHERRKAEVLTPEAPAPEQAPRVSVLVAAKDEQATIAACIRSMLAQDYANLEMIVVDDRSEDRTAQICRDLQAEGLAFRLIQVDELPAGWSGKNHAMHLAAREATGDWLCMIDADCRQTSERTVSVAVAHACRTGAELLSVLPTLEMSGFWENVIQPVCSGVMMIWIHPDKVNNPRRRNAYANGAFMLMRRETYHDVGGHEAMAGTICEDLALARRTKASGHNLRVVRASGLYSVRMYTRLREMLRGWTRIFHGTFDTARKLTLAAVVLVVMGWLPYVTAALGWVLWAGGSGGWLVPAIVGTAAAGLQISVIARFLRLLGGRPWLAWTYPLGAGMAMYCVLRALSKRRRGATLEWRGTTYASAGRSDQQTGPQQHAGAPD